MNEDFNTRFWADHGPKFFADIAYVVRKARVALTRLNAIEFDAPWRREAGVKDRCSG